MSFHGRVPKEESLRYEAGRKLGFLTDKEHNPAAIAQILMEHGWPADTKSVALERLSYEDERIEHGTLTDITRLSGFEHSVFIVLG